VLGYNQKRQLQFLSGLAGSDISWHDMVVDLLLAVGSIVFVISMVMLYGGRKTSDPAQRLYLRFLRKLSRAGVTHRSQEGALDLAARAATALPAKATLIREICHIYTELRYGGASEKQFQHLQQLIKTL